MKRFVTFCTLLLVVVFAVGALCACKPNQTQVDSLVVYNWADYIYDYEEDFKQYYLDHTGREIEITYVTFDTNETMLTKVMKGDSNVDVICPSEYAIQKLLESNSLVPLNYFDEEQYTKGMQVNGYVHNASNVEPAIVDKVSQTFGNVTVNGQKVDITDYMVPYMYGTLGILYNKYRFMELGIYDEQIMNTANWGILFNDDGNGNLLSDGLTGSILMKDSIRDSYAATLFYMLQSGKLDKLTFQDQSSPYYGTAYADMPIGELINAVDDQLLELCADLLANQKEQLFGYEVDFGKDDLLKGNAMVDLAWSGDALYAVEESWDDSLGEEGDYELAYYVPNGAGNIWLDGWVIPTTHNPEHITAIKLFINFLNSPYVAAQNMLEIGYTSAVNRELVRNDVDARSVLAEGYLVYAPEYWSVTDERGNALSVDDCDYASWAEFEQYFFDSIDAMDNSNWRYPFDIQTGNYNRSLDTLGVMRDFGANNKKVVTMWNYARSAGTTALPLLLWTAVVVAVAIGALVIVFAIKEWRNKYVKV